MEIKTKYNIGDDLYFILIKSVPKTITHKKVISISTTKTKLADGTVTECTTYKLGAWDKLVYEVTEQDLYTSEQELKDAL